MKDGKRIDSELHRNADVVLDRGLRSLPTWDPTPGFENRVMSRIRVSAPGLVHRFQCVGQSLFETRRVCVLLGSLLGVSALTTAVLTAVLIKQGVVVEGTASWVVSNIGIPAWRASLEIIADVARDGYALLIQQRLSVTAFAMMALSSLAFLSFNSWMLYRVMQPAFSMRSK